MTRWQAGDRAICVNPGATRLIRGLAYTVTRVEVAGPEFPDAGTVGLHLEESKGNFGGGYRADRFRRAAYHRTFAAELLAQADRLTFDQGAAAYRLRARQLLEQANMIEGRKA